MKSKYSFTYVSIITDACRYTDSLLRFCVKMNQTGDIVTALKIPLSGIDSERSGLQISSIKGNNMVAL